MNDTTEFPGAESLETHLKRENPLLLEPLAEFRRLDRVARRMHLLGDDDSFTRRVPWWPVISLLGTFSAGKSTFINTYLGQALKPTGNQAVDDRFSVICYGEGETARTLPGSALDADPRFPFYRISSDIDEVAAGEGRRINTYLQLLTSDAENLRGRILLDSPGFDADSQRTATLRITDRIIDLSDLVLVFFDARHPEPGAMRDTLQHLVADTIQRDDAAKFVFVLNQIDITAREDNPEDIVAAWQRALASSGLTAGRFLRIYDEDAAAPIEDPALAERFKEKKDADLDEIHRRMEAVSVDRAYRVVEMLTGAARSVNGADGAGRVREYCRRWRVRTLALDGVALVVVLLLLGAALIWAYNTTTDVLSEIGQGSVTGWFLIGAAIAVALTAHFSFRGLVARRLAAAIPPARNQSFGLDIRRAVVRNTRWWRSLFWPWLKGWHPLAQRSVTGILTRREAIVQRLNDRFTQPSG